MKGTTHLLIGMAVGTAVGLQQQTDFQTGILCVAVAAFSALAADLDGPSILSGKIGKFSKFLREGVMGGGIVLAALIYGWYRYSGSSHPTLALSAGALFLLGFLFKEGTIRNALVSAVGAAFLVYGYREELVWLMGFGGFVVIAPWLKHRGMTHTLWAAAAWAWISQGFEAYLGQPGIMLAGTIGYLSHLLADTLTPGGVKWLSPIIKKSIRLPF